MSAADPARQRPPGTVERLHALIRRLGPLSVAAFMGEVVLHPEDGYYRARHPIGRGGDFITAPEISQMFGELIGLWLSATWEAAGRPDPALLVELGPGRGTLMADALRTLARIAPGFRAAIRLHLVESSRALRAEQGERLATAGAAWHPRLDDVPEGPLFLVANEFFDALPVHQLVRTATGWGERLVDSDGARFAHVLDPRPSPLAALVPAALADVAVGTVVEVAPAAIALVDRMTRRIVAEGGAALIVDYGPAKPTPGATLRGVSAHVAVDPLALPGSADLSVEVDFATLARAAREAGGAVFGPVRQGDFLAALGLGARTERLLAAASPRQADEVQAAARRLADPAGMGGTFKALAVLLPGVPAPPGFAP